MKSKTGLSAEVERAIDKEFEQYFEKLKKEDPQLYFKHLESENELLKQAQENFRDTVQAVINEIPIEKIAKDIINDIFKQSEPVSNKLTKTERRQWAIEAKKKEIAEANLQAYLAKNK